jgi:hypothetical protein
MSKEMGPAEEFEWVENYAADMAATTPNDTIAESTWAVNNGLILGATKSFTDTTATQWVTYSGDPWTKCDLTNTVVTAAGRTFVRTLVILIVPQTCT